MPFDCLCSGLQKREEVTSVEFDLDRAQDPDPFSASCRCVALGYVAKTAALHCWPSGWVLQVAEAFSLKESCQLNCNRCFNTTDPETRQITTLPSSHPLCAGITCMRTGKGFKGLETRLDFSGKVPPAAALTPSQHTWLCHKHSYSCCALPLDTLHTTCQI